MYKKMLIPLDGSLLAEQALEPAITLAQKFSSKIYLIQVVTDYLIGSYGIDYQFHQQYIDVAHSSAQTYLAQLQKDHFGGEFMGNVETAVLTGVAADSILDYAQAKDIDIIVMATHGRSGIGRWVFGSVAERVLRGSTCPVLVVRAQEEDIQSTQDAENWAQRG